MKPAQFVTRQKLAFKRLLGAEQVQLGHEVEGDDGVASRGIEQQVARDGHQIASSGGDPLERLRRVGADQALRHQVLDVKARRANATQTRAHLRLMRQDYGLEPL